MSFKGFGVGIIGCGLIGQKRAKSLGHNGKLMACADIDFDKALALANSFDAKPFRDWRDLLAVNGIDIVIISTLHNSLAEITLAAIRSGKNVLVEKPAARNYRELEPIVAEIKLRNIKVHVGFNHRYHRAFRKAKEIVNSNVLGELMFIRGRYGHGARVGYENEWRADPKISGGGELIDQGPHLIDLSRWFFGDFPQVSGFAHNYYWDMPVDDNCFMLLKTQQNQTAFLHVSCTEWKNNFSFEIYGQKGKLEISGLGGSYGVEKITHYKMLPEMGPPETTSWEYPMADDSWSIEIEEFYKDIILDRESESSLADAYEALKIIDKIYKESGYDYCT
jgi:predicted dehydrogenase